MSHLLDDLNAFNYDRNMVPAYAMGVADHRYGPLPKFPGQVPHGPPQPEPNVPDDLGYIWAALIAIAIEAAVASLPILLALAWAAGPFAIIPAIVIYPIVFALVTAAVAPLALLSTWLTHMASRRVRHQGLHVLIAGLFGWATAELYMFIPALDESKVQAASVVMGFSTATGRLCMIEHVQRRRYLASIGRLPRQK